MRTFSLPDASPGAPPREATPAGAERAAAEFQLSGVVQGVGFRPFVHRLALQHGLAGSVRNEAGAVRIVAEGPHAALSAFQAGLVAQAPPLARVDRLERLDVPPTGLRGFRVAESSLAPDGRLPVSPDVAICDGCLAELLDPADRRFRYPFITCTDCGPRFTVIEAMPYDRERSTMAAFRQCPACLAEYRDPRDRRYHSETNSCPACGPTLWLEDASGRRTEGDAAIAGAAAHLALGHVLAVRGLGGFHLAADAGSELAIRRLRARKHRDAKPLALMVGSLEQARALARTSEGDERLLASRERPIVVLPLREGARVARAVAPGLDSVGIMIAYTPLHVLLLEAADRPLVMTSGNLSEEPIATGNAEARRRLGSVADAFLLHDREIVARYDDSVVRPVDGTAVFLRRARGYAPLPLPLPVPERHPFLAVGPHLKNTFTLAQDGQAWVSQHVGDLENVETLEHFRDALARLSALFRVQPQAVVRDLHPGYLSTRVAQEMELPELPPVQHHHAHVAAVQAEHGVTEPVLGLAFDGTGFGDDGKVWGAELLVADLTGYRRAAHLRYARMPGGDHAARTPWRCALGYQALDPDALELEAAFAEVPAAELAVARRQVARGVNAPEASSMGRLFDAAAAVLGLRRDAAYEGQAPMELEACAADLGGPVLPFPVRWVDGMRVMDPVPLLQALELGRRSGVAPARLAAGFHEAVARTAVAVAEAVCEEEGLGTVALGGGCFQNARLLRTIRRGLEARGLRVLVPRLLGPNDGAVSYGQAVVAAARMDSQDGGR